MADESEKPVKTPQATLEAAKEESIIYELDTTFNKKVVKPGKVIVEVFYLSLYILKDDSNHLDNSQD